MTEDIFKLYDDAINGLNKNSITYFVCYLEKEERHYIEASLIDRILHKEMCTKS